MEWIGLKKRTNLWAMNDLVWWDSLWSRSVWEAWSSPAAARTRKDHHWGSSCLRWSPWRWTGHTHTHSLWARRQLLRGEAERVPLRPDGGGGGVPAHGHPVLPLSDLLGPVRVQPRHRGHVAGVNHGHDPVLYAQLTETRRRRKTSLSSSSTVWSLILLLVTGLHGSYGQPVREICLSSIKLCGKKKKKKRKKVREICDDTFLVDKQQKIENNIIKVKMVMKKEQYWHT